MRLKSRASIHGLIMRAKLKSAKLAAAAQLSSSIYANGDREDHGVRRGLEHSSVQFNSNQIISIYNASDGRT